MSRTETLRLEWPRWQGGMNPDYVTGEQVMEAIVPHSSQAVTERICCMDPVNGDDGDTVDEQVSLEIQNSEAMALLEKYDPDKVLVIGGDCSVSQVPFSWLHRKYGEQFGIIWLDAHPDISLPGQTRHLHEMPVSSLLGLAQEAGITREPRPLKPDHILYAGLIEEDLRPMDQAARDLNITVMSPEQLKNDPDLVSKWIREKNLRYIAVHWDLDVLSPKDFHGIYPNQPEQDGPFPAAVGRMSLQTAGNILLSVQNNAQLTGLSIAEYLPWDAIRLHSLFESLDIMK